jgi:hypothetical protein
MFYLKLNLYYSSIVYYNKMTIRCHFFHFFGNFEQLFRIFEQL